MKGVAIKPLFSPSASITGKLVLCIVVSVVLMTVDHRFKRLDRVRSALSTVVYPLQYLVDLPARVQLWASETVAARHALLRENHGLRERQLLLRARLEKLSAVEREIIRLRALLKSSYRLPREKVLVADLLVVDMDPYKQYMVVNKGAVQGVYVGQALLDAYGVVGQITHVNPISATAILISDPNHALPVEIDRNGMRMLAFGTGNPRTLSLRYVSTNADVEVGDVISTSGLGGRYPPDYPVGRITRVKHRPGEPFALVEAQPFAHLDRGREVLLVWSEPQPPTDAMQAAPPPTSELGG